MSCVNKPLKPRGKACWLRHLKQAMNEEAVLHTLLTQPASVPTCQFSSHRMLDHWLTRPIRAVGRVRAVKPPA